MLNRILLTLVITTTPGYLRAANATADVKTAAAQQHAQPPQIPDDVIPPHRYKDFRVLSQFTENDCKRIIEWLKEDPQNRKNAYSFSRIDGRDHSLWYTLCRIRFYNQLPSPAIQPALDFLLTLRPRLDDHRQQSQSYTDIEQMAWKSTLSPLFERAPKHPCNENDSAAFYKLVKQITRLMFFNGKNLQQIKDIAAYFIVFYEGRIRTLTREQDHSTARSCEQRINFCKASLEEIGDIHQEAVERLTSLSSPINQALLPELWNIVGEYSTELSVAEAQRALRELSTRHYSRS
jgi:hypothetical protein